MKRTAQEILDMPEFNLFFNPQEIAFFVPKRKDALEMIREITDLLGQKSIDSFDPQKREQEIDAFKRSVLDQEYVEMEIQDNLEKLDEIMEFINQNRSSVSKEELKAKMAERESIRSKIDELIKRSDELSRKIRSDSLRLRDSDAYATHMNADASREVLSRNTKKISGDCYALFQAMLAKRYYTWLINAEKGFHSGHDEFCFANRINCFNR